jgi:hypothetical protein
MTTMNSVVCYKKWDNINRRYLVKTRIEDEWELSLTPAMCCTNGRKFDPHTCTYIPPPFRACDVPRAWDEKEGVWIFKVAVKIKDAGHDGDYEGEEEGTFHGETKQAVDSTGGVNICDAQKKYF